MNSSRFVIRQKAKRSRGLFTAGEVPIIGRLHEKRNAPTATGKLCDSAVAENGAPTAPGETVVYRTPALAYSLCFNDTRFQTWDDSTSLLMRRL